MNQQSLGPKDGGNPPGTATEAGAGKASGATPAPAKHQTVLGPFTLRDLTVFGSTAILFVASLLPMFGARFNLWNLNNLFLLGIGIILPLIVAALFVARRLQPANVVRIGSLSIDQFASVSASFAVALFFLTIADAFTPGSFLGLLGALAFLAATVLAPHLPWFSADFAGRVETPAHPVAREAAVPSRKPAVPKTPKAPKTSQAAGPAGPSAWGPATGPTPGGHQPAPNNPAPNNPAASTGSPVPMATTGGTAGTDPVSQASAAADGSSADEAQGKAPAAPEPAAMQAPRPLDATMATPVVPADTRTAAESIGATVDPASRPGESAQAPAHEAFWFAVAQPRTAVNEHTGEPAFRIEPGGWVLALEDRGHEFLVQDTDGKVGVLRDLSHIERG